MANGKWQNQFRNHLRFMLLAFGLCLASQTAAADASEEIKDALALVGTDVPLPGSVYRISPEVPPNPCEDVEILKAGDNTVTANFSRSLQNPYGAGAETFWVLGGTSQDTHAYYGCGLSIVREILPVRDVPLVRV